MPTRGSSVIDFGTPMESSSVLLESPHRKSLFRNWKRLSRFQKNLVYLATVIATLFLVYYMSFNSYTVPEVRPVAVITEDDLDNNVLGLLAPDSKNKVKEVQNVLKPIKDSKSPVFPIDKVESVEEDNAKEDYVDEKMYDEGEDDKENRENKPKENINDNLRGDSNEAAEKHLEEHILPPPDGSLVFKGPTNDRQKAVVDAFLHAWNGYKSYAWGHDHLRPISKGAQNWFGLGLTLIDSLDTMFVMNLKEEFDEARDWVSSSLSFSINKDVNLFETTIRVLGGLLSAFHLSGDNVFLEKAKDLGQRLMGAFSSSSGIPYSDVNLKSTRGHAPKWSPDSSTSEVTTIQLEFRDLSRCSQDSQFEDAVTKISEIVHGLGKTEGLVPIFINANSGKFRKSSTITFGARGDSYYEYLLKQWIQTGKRVDMYRDDFLQAMKGVINRLAKRTVPNRLLYIGEIVSGGKEIKPKMDELACFLPGTLALAHHHGLSLTATLPPKNANQHSEPSNNALMELAEELAYTCYLTFARQPTYLAPEITHFNSAPSSTTDFYVKPADSHYLLRPETIESLWYLYYVTGNKTYQDWGWNIFQGIQKYTRVLNGYTTIGNVKNPLDLRPKDMMESFFLGETLKYLYLLMADKQEIDISQWVFNTEAHPLPIHPS